VLSVLNGAYEPTGTYGHEVIVQLNSDLAALYPANYLDIRSLLVMAYDPTQPQDVIDYSDDVPPQSLRWDVIHLNAAGYTLVAKQVEASLTASGYIAATAAANASRR
jgi:lysophospholipase L1-like esterase